MLRSLYSGISGLRAHQQLMDVTGNNIANVNTTGYKSSQATFQDTLSQTINAPGASRPDQGGTNPAQIGLGVQLGGITTNFGQGATQTTGRTTDLTIQGNGFFVVQQGAGSVYTRNGSFSFDGEGDLVNTDGRRVMGWNAVGGVVTPAGAPAPIQVPNVADLASLSISQDGTLVGVFADGTRQNLAQIALADFANPEGLEKIGDSMYRETVNSGVAGVGVAGADGLGLMQSGRLEMSNVDLAQEFTNLVIAQRGFQANSRIITASDELLQDLVNLKR